MKKLSFITVILLCCYMSASSQSCLPEGITFETQAQIDSFSISYPNCTAIEGMVFIAGDDITNLDGLIALTSIGGDCIIGNNELLNSLTGLGNLTSIEGSLKIGYYKEIGAQLILYINPSLNSLSGLSGLDHINGNLWIIGNFSLSSLTGLNNISNIENDLIIWYDTALNDMTGLDKLTFIGGDLSVQYNIVLPSLTGLDNITAASIKNLNISFNFKLSQCEVKSVCEYLTAPNGNIIIKLNGPGCFDLEEVESGCEDFSIEEQFGDYYLSLYPNPACQKLNISIGKGYAIDEVYIFTLTGQQVLRVRPASGTIDISLLQPGMYIVEVTIENTRLRQKLLVHR